MSFSKTFNTKWITDKIDNNCVNFAEEFGKYLCDLQRDRAGRDALTTSQIRIFFGEVKRIEMKGYEEEKTAFLLIRPKLAYAEARALNRNRRSRIVDFRKIVEKAHQAVTDTKSFGNFVDFFTATLAYHKAYGGKD